MSLTSYQKPIPKTRNFQALLRILYLWHTRTNGTPSISWDIQLIVYHWNTTVEKCSWYLMNLTSDFHSSQRIQSALEEKAFSNIKDETLSLKYSQKYGSSLLTELAISLQREDSQQHQWAECLTRIFQRNITAKNCSWFLLSLKCDLGSLTALTVSLRARKVSNTSTRRLSWKFSTKYESPLLSD